MTDIINFQLSTFSDNKKRITLPFSGFVDSIYHSLVASQLEDMIEDGVDKAVVIGLAGEIDWGSHYLKVSNAYASYISKRFNEVFSTNENPVNIHLSQVLYHPLNETKNGDKISAVIDVDEIPNLAALMKFCDEKGFIDFREALISAAKDRIPPALQTSKYYLPHNQALWDYYSNWERESIECLVIAMIQVVNTYDGFIGADWQSHVKEFEDNGFTEDAYTKGIQFVDNLYADQHLKPAE
ncbi:hypothetical protein [uncultured Psychrobacter sp.]|uniref:hypothetical protein n=1 Tax=uncultured Psychrobacter sp. TaxID=259303 RepID=UPI0030DDBB96